MKAQTTILDSLDGSDLLRLGAQYEVHIKPTMDPVGIFVKGEKSKVKGLQQRLLSWKAVGELLHWFILVTYLLVV